MFSNINRESNHFKVQRNKRTAVMTQQSKDPFEAAFEEQHDIEDSPPASPTATVSLAVDENAQTLQNHPTQEDDDAVVAIPRDREPPLAAAKTTTTSITPCVTVPNSSRAADEEEDEENMDVELSKFPSSADPLKMAKMQFCSCLLYILFFF